MATAYAHKDTNIRKTWFLMLTFFLVVIALGWGFSWYFGSSLILYGAVAFALIMNVGSYWYSHKLVVKMANAHPMPDEGNYSEVHNLVENLAITAGLPKPDLYVIKDQAPNAFATGRNPEHAVIAVTTGLLDILDRTELEGVLAHELSHIGNRDMAVSTIAVVLVGFVAILADMFIWGSLLGGDDEHKNPWFAAAGFAAALLAPLAAQLIQMAVSRKREFLADASGALLTRYPEGLASALTKISGHGQKMQRTSHATAHLFIANPFGGGSSIAAGVEKAFSSHPPVEERVSALRNQH